MNKICCVGDADICPKSSSCSMVLRSACSHRHSRESSTVKEHLHVQSTRKSKRASTDISKNSCNGTLHLEAAIESSLKELALKSSKSYSVLKKTLYGSFEFPGDINQNILETSPINVSCSKELHFSQLSASNNSSGFSNSINFKECSSDYSSGTESDINSSGSLNSTSNMSRSHYTRSSIASMRSLSGSEGEDDSPSKNILRSRNHKSDGLTNFSASGRSISQMDINSQFLSNSHIRTENHDLNSHISRYTGSSHSDSSTHFSEASHLDRSTVQCSLFDRFRWFLFRCTYLKIIKVINFDVWFLSRLHNCAKHKTTAIFLLLLPLLLFLMWGLIRHNPLSVEGLSQALNSVISSVILFMTSVYSSLYGFFVQKEKVVTAAEIADTSCISDSSRIISFFPNLLELFSVISGWLVKAGESASFITTSTYESKEPEYQPIFNTFREETKSLQPNKEEMRLLAMEVLKDEVNSLKELLKSDTDRIQTDKWERERKLQSEIKNLQFEFQSLSRTMQNLEKNIARQSEKSETTENIIAVTNEYKRHIDQLNLKLKAIEAKLGILEGLKSCCDKQWNQDDFLALLEKHLIEVFKNIIDGDSESKYYFFNQWLNSKFFSHQKLMQEINAALKKQSTHSEDAMNYDNVIKIVENAVLKHVDSIKKKLTDFNSGYLSLSKNVFSEDKVKKIVKEAIMLYDADKIGQVDYALESGGGSVLGTRCSETYVEKYGKLSIFGVPLWTSSNSPRTAIQPEVQPGRCWAFKGSQGFLVLELSATIYPTGFTLEHIPVSLSPTGSVDSAPKNFSVWGLESDKDSKGYLLGEYWYDINGEPLQYFAVQKQADRPYSYIELQIHNNHGNMEYTCLYRFRVHGQRVE